MGCIPVLAACITSFNVQFADLPTEALSYDGTSRDVSKFYKQKVPNVYLNGQYYINDNNVINWNLNTGTHTKKLNTGSVGIEWVHVESFENGWYLKTGLGADINITKHKPCDDSVNRKYYCGNLTAWSDFKETQNEYKINPKANFSISYRW